MSLPVRIVAICAVTALFVGCFFALAGRLDWVWGWVYITLLIACSSINDLLLWVWNPGLFARRGRMGKGTKTWDKVCLAVFGASFCLILIVGALDAGRFRDSWMPLWLQMAGVALFIGGQALVTWSMLVNPFFEKTARLQRDCDQRVVDTGPYRHVRHPGYTGTIAGYALGTPLILGSWWAFIPAVVAALCLVLRTLLEDRMLCAELKGYTDYCERVPTRLLPFMWSRSKYPPPAR